MAAKGLFTTGFTLAEVQDIHAKAKEILSAGGGKTLMSWSDGAVNSSRSFAMPVKEVLVECGIALRALDPDTYGRRATRTVVSFSGNF